MKEAAQNITGEWTNISLRLAAFFKCLPEDIFSPLQQQRALRINRASAQLSFVEIQQLTTQQQTDPEIRLQAAQFAAQLRDTLSTLNPRQQLVLRRRFGIDCEEQTLQEIAQEVGVTSEVIRQNEAAALRKLKHPSRAKRLLATVGTIEQVDSPWGLRTQHIIDEAVMDALREG